jgi:hypothetical protein
MNKNRLRKIVPTDGAKLLIHSFRLVTWHAYMTLGLAAPDMKSCTKKKTIGSKRETGGEPAGSLRCLSQCLL